MKRSFHGKCVVSVFGAGYNEVYGRLVPVSILFIEVTKVFHVYIRIIISFIWLVVAVISGISGKLQNAALYVVLAGLILYSAYAAWKKEKGD